ncbi:hypothetical protein PybrP1_011517 [[Pythium] brassicae (nom. inval.)]|nr:hypothetical protein PybrP1_011517 [[Pythium] brassicae (nom. inval.)]
MSDRDSPAASPARRPRADSDSRSPAASPKSSPRAASATAARDDSDEAPADAADAADGRRATSRSPSPRGERREPARDDRGNGTNLNPGNNLYIANLPHSLVEADLEELFSKFGRLEKCEVILDPATRESRGFGFVTFDDVRDASDAVNELNGKEIQGRRIRVEHAKRQRGHEKTPGKYLGPRQASSKYGRDVRGGGGGGGGGRSRSRSRDRVRRSRSRSRDRGRRYDDRDRYERSRYDDRGRGHDRDRYDGRSRR